MSSSRRLLAEPAQHPAAYTFHLSPGTTQLGGAWADIVPIVHRRAGRKGGLMEDTPKRSAAPYIVLRVVTEDLASVAPGGTMIVTNCADQVLIHDA